MLKMQLRKVNTIDESVSVSFVGLLILSVPGSRSQSQSQLMLPVPLYTRDSKSSEAADGLPFCLETSLRQELNVSGSTPCSQCSANGQVPGLLQESTVVEAW